jgi:hypothetical protein
MIPGVGLFDFFGLEVLNTLRLTGLASAMGESDRGSCDRWRGEEGPADCRSWSSSIIWVMTKLSLVQHGKSDRQSLFYRSYSLKGGRLRKVLERTSRFLESHQHLLASYYSSSFASAFRMCLPDIFLCALPLEIRSLT